MEVVSSMLVDAFTQLNRAECLASQNTTCRGLVFKCINTKAMAVASNANVEHKFEARHELYGTSRGLLEYIEQSYQVLYHFFWSDASESNRTFSIILLFHHSTPEHHMLRHWNVPDVAECSSTSWLPFCLPLCSSSKSENHARHPPAGSQQACHMHLFTIFPQVS
jgi:hypothetical protein